MTSFIFAHSEKVYQTTSQIQAANNSNAQNENAVQTQSQIQAKILTQTQIKNIIKTRNRIRTYYANQSECPENCTCTGSVTKCELDDGREMTVRAGKS